MRLIAAVCLILGAMGCKNEETNSQTEDVSDFIRVGDNEGFSTKRTTDVVGIERFADYQNWVTGHKITYEQGNTGAFQWVLSRIDKEPLLTEAQIKEHQKQKKEKMQSMLCSDQPKKEIDLELALGIISAYFPDRMERLKVYLYKHIEQDRQLGKSIPGFCPEDNEYGFYIGCNETKGVVDRKLAAFKKFAKRDIDEYITQLDMITNKSESAMLVSPARLSFDTSVASKKLIADFMVGTYDSKTLVAMKGERDDLYEKSFKIADRLRHDPMLNQSVSRYVWESMKFHEVILDALDGVPETVNQIAATRMVIETLVTAMQVPYLPTLVLSGVLAALNRKVEDSTSSVAKVSLYVQYLIREGAIEKKLKCDG